MASLPGTLLSSLAALCTAAGPATVLPEANVAEVLRTAQVAADRVAGGTANADDLVGEAMLRLLRRHPDVFGGKDRRAYVRQVVKNVYLDELRRRRRSISVRDVDDDDPAGGAALPPAEAGDELHTLIVEEFRAALNERDREVLDLLVLDESDRAIAKLLGRTRHDVRTSVARIRRTAERFFDEQPALAKGAGERDGRERSTRELEARRRGGATG